MASQSTKKKLFILLYLILSYTGTSAINRYFFVSHTTRNGSILNLIWMAVIFFLLIHAHKTTPKARFLGFLLGSLLAISLMLGKTLYQDNSLYSFFFPIKNLKVQLTCIIGFTVLLGAMLSILFAYLEISEHKDYLIHTNSWKLYQLPSVCWMGIFFLSWLPCYLSYYPGIYSYDMDDLTNQALGITPFTRFHPPLHTLFWKACLFLQSILPIEPIIVYSICQMFLFAAVFARVIHFLIKKRFHNGIILGNILFFALNPTIAIFSFIPTKDACFAAAFLLLTIELCELVTHPLTYKIPARCSLRLVLSILLCCLFRNNAIYALLLFAPVVTFFLYRNRRKIAVLFVFSFLCFFFIDGVLYGAFGIEKGDNREILSVPIQQIANVVTMDEESLTNEEKAQIDQYLPYDAIKESYNPRFADPVKQSFQTDTFNEDKAAFFRLWFHLFTRYPGNYLNAFLSLNLPYWYLDAYAIDEYAKREYIETFIYDYDSIGYTFERDSKLPWLYERYEKLASYQRLGRKPIIANIFSLSMPFWLTLTCCFILFLKNRRKLCLILLPSLLLWLTFIAGPVSNFRYIFPIHMQYTLFISIALQPSCLTRTERLNETSI